MQKKKVLLEWGNSALFSSTGKWKRSLIITCKLGSLFTVTIYNAVFIWNIFPCPSGKKAGNQSFPFPEVIKIPCSIYKGNAIIHCKTTDEHSEDLLNLKTKQKAPHKKKCCWIFEICFFIIIYCTKEQRGSFTISLSALKKSVVFPTLKPKSVFIIGLGKRWRFVHLLIRQHRH